MNFLENHDSSTLNPFGKAVLVIASLCIAFVAARLIITPYHVANNAMLPNYAYGDLLLVLKAGQPAISDVVLFRSPAEPDRVMLKRIIAAEGDLVEVRDKIFYINGQRLVPKWKTRSMDKRMFPMRFTFRDNYPAQKIKRNHFFMAGDNLDYSADSRSFGQIAGDRIIGRVVWQW